MGRIKQKNFRYHSSAPVAMDTDAEPEFDPLKQQSNLIHSSPRELRPVQVQNNVFRNILIPPSVLKQELPQFHTSTITLSKFDERRATNFNEIKEVYPLCLEFKKELLQHKKSVRKKRLTLDKALAECIKRKKKKEAVLSDWKSLKDALCEPEISSSSLSQTRPMKRKEIEAQMMQASNSFRSALELFSWNKTMTKNTSYYFKSMNTTE